MSMYLYLSMVPESLVASMLRPREFGTYLAIGPKEQSRQQAMFLDLKPDFASADFDLSRARRACVPHPDGTPKHSVYLTVYRVMERVPLDAVNNLYLVTRDGRVLELKPGPLPKRSPAQYHLYQEICPVHPLIASRLGPEEFRQFITDPSGPISVPRICFVDLALGNLATDPAHADTRDLPYHHLDHVRECLLQLRREEDKETKTVDRVCPGEFPYRCVRSGFFLADARGMLFFPFPAREELDRLHHDWWRSANV